MPVDIYVEYPCKSQIKQGTKLFINCIPDKEQAMFLIVLLLIVRNVTTGDMEITHMRVIVLCWTLCAAYLSKMLVGYVPAWVLRKRLNE